MANQECIQTDKTGSFFPSLACQIQKKIYERRIMMNENGQYELVGKKNRGYSHTNVYSDIKYDVRCDDRHSLCILASHSLKRSRRKKRREQNGPNITQFV